MLKRIGLFLLVNMAVMMTIITVLNLLGIRNYLTPMGIDYRALLGFCLVYGMVGSLISLAISKHMAKWMMGLEIIKPETHNPMERHLVDVVSRLSSLVGLKVVPEVAIYHSPEVNAFATGPSRNNSLVAVSSGLLNQMSEAELEGVLAHEVSHIANGDMVTMTLIQGVVNAFVMFFSKALAWILANAMNSNSSSDDNRSPSFFMVWGIEMVLYIIFGLLGSLVVAWFSRLREYRADKGGADIAGTGKMVAALERLRRSIEGHSAPVVHGSGQEAIASLKISGGSSWLALFSTHPSLENRINRLKGQF